MSKRKFPEDEGGEYKIGKKRKLRKERHHSIALESNENLGSGPLSKTGQRNECVTMKKMHKNKQVESTEPKGSGAFDNGEPLILNQSRSTETRKRQSSLRQWQLSKPVGGSLLDLDPVFSEDEQHVTKVIVTVV